MKITLEQNDVTITVTNEPEYIKPEGQFYYGDSLEEKQAVQTAIDKIYADLEAGNDWAWCSVKVTVNWGVMFEASDYLGSCSYASEDDFIKNSGYYDDMVYACLRQIEAEINEYLGGYDIDLTIYQECLDKRMEQE